MKKETIEDLKAEIEQLDKLARGCYERIGDINKIIDPFKDTADLYKISKPPKKKQPSLLAKPR